MNFLQRGNFTGDTRRGKTEEQRAKDAEQKAKSKEQPH
jgi:hypothetical protein